MAEDLRTQRDKMEQKRCRGHREKKLGPSKKKKMKFEVKELQARSDQWRIWGGEKGYKGRILGQTSMR